MPRRGPGWVPFCGLPPGEKLFQGYWRCLAPLQNQRGQLPQSPNITKLVQKLARIVNNQWKLTISPFPSQPRLLGLQWKWKEYGRNRWTYARLGTCLGKGPGWVPFCGLPPGKNYSRGIGDAWHTSKAQVGSCIFLFSLIPTRATTTTSPETGKTSKTNETMFHQWVAEEAKIWRYMIYAGSSWSKKDFV